ncbi:hypothetical protein E4U61_004514 [Claviceps capensis]|nr:hypothetical protein E4U61_004514 [Claviceps capensis]
MPVNLSAAAAPKRTKSRFREGLPDFPTESSGHLEKELLNIFGDYRAQERRCRELNLHGVSSLLSALPPGSAACPKEFFETLPVLNANEYATKEDWAAMTVLANMSSTAGLDLTLSALTFKIEKLRRKQAADRQRQIRETLEDMDHARDRTEATPRKLFTDLFVQLRVN